jgi:hypothetical protein
MAIDARSFFDWGYLSLLHFEALEASAMGASAMGVYGQQGVSQASRVYGASRWFWAIWE